MSINIEKMPVDMQAESRRFTLQIFAMIAVTAAATATVVGLILHSQGKV